ncbi:flagellar motor protein MotD [Pseudomonas sp. IC_126]|uniref:flagellar motor protein MotD n=1 Tax=Pseudomonas sp. IC_126 TaxID=2547400 RepID=UPI0010386FF7|nr:flagellar motor protein MotD [Pseudomonas sp. IC_126]TCD21177.1 flagellar motor protein MotD [Pseudomonas sp. IC_126]
MARRRAHEEPENHERWLVSYADFITLLFAFFVVMYSISSLNEGKYKILSDSLVGVFNQVDRAVKPIPIGEERPRTTEPDVSQVDEPQSSREPIDPLQSIMQSMQEAFADLIDAKQLTVRGNELWVEIELNSSLLFPSGDALPNDHAFELLERVAGILAPFDNPIHVEGFTDNLPISTNKFPTNWELSTARAGSVVRMLAADGVDPSRLAAVGYGEFQPIADNATAEGRARNRRVILVISRNLDVRRSISGVGSGNARTAGVAQHSGTHSASSESR